ncbi:hypothetical protein CK203_089502 [Vitis vinifera]|uniref:Uncharacterized protein n=1 Tax=Vitis vinifera TaxID=29760 RepID=A0A438FJ59_VITVI|nr:hypothetical protein CK203_089502 [Vitis vinifera]
MGERLKNQTPPKICDGSVVRSYQEPQSESASAAEFVFREAVFHAIWAKVGSFRPEDGRLFEIRVASRKASSLVVRAMGKKNHDNSSSSGNFFFLRLHGFWISSL